MADKKISQLTTLAQADVAVTADFLPIVDTSATETKKATPQALVQAGATGATLPVALGAVGTPSYTFTGDLNTGLWSPAADTVAFSTAGSERMRLDSSGNLGLGVTPSAWSGVQGVFEIRGNAYLYSTTGVLSSGANAFFNGTNWIYKTTQAATRYEQVNGVHQWGTAPSGTAGNAITFTQAMTLDASGNLGIGTASPSVRLDVNGNAQLRASGYLMFLNSDNTNNYYIQNGGATGSGNPVVSFIQGGVGERMRLDNAGNLGIGTASPGSRLHVAENGTGAYSFVRVTNSNSTATVLFGVGGSAVGNSALQNNAIIYNTGNSAMVFGTNDAERMRITAAGNIVAGASAALATTATDGFLYVPTCAGTPTGTPTAITGMAPIVVNTTNNKLYFYSGGQWRDAGP